MDLFVARQPIYNKDLKVYAYELLYRKTLENRFIDTNADEATSHVMVNSFHILGIEKLTGGCRAFVNFTGNLLKEGIATLFPADMLVVEILETVEPSPEIVAACKQLKSKQYLLALDDFVNHPDYQPLVDIADIIKVDFIASTLLEKQQIVKKLGNGHIRFLAEKIETKEDFEQAVAWGYTLFQGYYFSKPTIQLMGDISPVKLNYMRLIQQIHQSDFEFSQIAKIVAQDVSLTYKLLKLVNSSAFGLMVKIESVKHALVVLGEMELKKWISLLAMRGIGEDKSDEMIRVSLIRAKFSEMIGKASPLKMKSDDLFLIGLFSCIDYLLSRPLDEILSGLSLPDGVKIALLQREGLYGFVYQMILSYESGQFDEACRFPQIIGVTVEQMTRFYINAVSWTDEILNIM